MKGFHCIYIYIYIYIYDAFNFHQSISHLFFSPKTLANPKSFQYRWLVCHNKHTRLIIHIIIDSGDTLMIITMKIMIMMVTVRAIIIITMMMKMITTKNKAKHNETGLIFCITYCVYKHLAWWEDPFDDLFRTMQTLKFHANKVGYLYWMRIDDFETGCKIYPTIYAHIFVLFCRDHIINH